MSETNSAAAEPVAPHRYTAAMAADIEARWQDFWDAAGTYAAPNPSGDLAGDPAVVARPKKFIMDMFPYPSGAGLHVGHPLGYIATDVFARHQRMTGHNVLHTLGFDAFGLPAEQYAVQTGTHPRTSTEANMENMKAQLRRLGLGHDKRRSFATIDPDYYKWTQWIFVQIFNSWYDAEAKKARPISELVAQFESGERRAPTTRAWSELSAAERAEVLGDYRLAYASDAPVNWCPGLGTVLANEEVTADGRSERGNFPVFKAKLRQWNMRITAYADRLLDDLDALDWPEAIKLQQRNWIGRSEGARVDFAVGSEGDAITVFTTRQDTLFGATYMVLAPEHELVDSIVPDAWPQGTHEVWTGGHATPAEAVAKYRAFAASKSDVERQADAKEKTGVFTGAYAVNPVSGDQVPVFIADYVLMGYGTGAIMAVPAHDTRDFAFARAFELPMRCVVEPSDDRGTDASTWDDAFASYDAKLVNSTGAADLPGRPGRRRGQGEDHRLAGRARHRRGHRQLPPARLAVQPPALLGRALPHRLRRGRRRPLAARVDAAAGAARGRGLLAAHVRPGRRGHLARDAAVAQRGLGQRHPGPGRRPQGVPPRDQHHAQLGRFLLVRAALPGPAQQREAGRPGHRAVLDGPARGPAARRCRPVRRRRRARRAAPAVRALLVQGPVRPGARLVGRAVPQAVQPGHDPGVRLPGEPRLPGGGRRGRGARRQVLLRGRARQARAGQDGQVPEERGHSGRDLRRVRRGHPAPVRDGDGPAGRVAAVGHARGGRSVPPAAAAVAQHRRRDDRRGHRHRRRAGRGDPARPAQGDRRRRPATWRRCASTPPSPRSPS